jgi:hypothetical protein
MSPALISVNLCPFNEKKKKQLMTGTRGAHTSSQFEMPFWVHAWGGAGKAWPKYPINQCTGTQRIQFFLFF